MTPGKQGQSPTISDKKKYIYLSIFPKLRYQTRRNVKITHKEAGKDTLIEEEENKLRIFDFTLLYVVETKRSLTFTT